MAFNIIKPEQVRHFRSLYKPIVPTIGEGNGDPYLIMERFAKEAEKGGWVKEDVDLMIEEMQSANYDHLLVMAIEFTRNSEKDINIYDEDYDEDYPDD